MLVLEMPVLGLCWECLCCLGFMLEALVLEAKRAVNNVSSTCAGNEMSSKCLLPGISSTVQEPGLVAKY